MYLYRVAFRHAIITAVCFTIIIALLGGFYLAISTVMKWLPTTWLLEVCLVLEIIMLAYVCILILAKSRQDRVNLQKCAERWEIELKFADRFLFKAGWAGLLSNSSHGDSELPDWQHWTKEQFLFAYRTAAMGSDLGPVITRAAEDFLNKER